jgi:hypothetical protein
MNREMLLVVSLAKVKRIMREGGVCSLFILDRDSTIIKVHFVIKHTNTRIELHFQT